MQSATLGVVVASIKAQFAMSWRNAEDMLPVLTLPFTTLIFMAVLDFSGRRDLSSYALVAPILLTIAQMGIWTASELLVRDRWDQTLELAAITPSPYFLVLFARIPVLTSLGLVGAVEAWLILRLVFGVDIVLHHPWLILATLVLTIFASATVALITAALVCFVRSTRTLQNSVSFPLYLLGGVLVPASYLPDWLEPLSRAVFLYWSANLLRDAMEAAPVDDVFARLVIIFGLGCAAMAIGGVLIGFMLKNLRKEGSLGLV